MLSLGASPKPSCCSATLSGRHDLAERMVVGHDPFSSGAGLVDGDRHAPPPPGELTPLLDIGHQLDLLQFVSSLKRDQGSDHRDGSP